MILLCADWLLHVRVCRYPTWDQLITLERQTASDTAAAAASSSSSSAGAAAAAQVPSSSAAATATAPPDPSLDSLILTLLDHTPSTPSPSSPAPSASSSSSSSSSPQPLAALTLPLSCFDPIKQYQLQLTLNDHRPPTRLHATVGMDLLPQSLFQLFRVNPQLGLVEVEVAKVQSVVGAAAAAAGQNQSVKYGELGFVVYITSQYEKYTQRLALTHVSVPPASMTHCAINRAECAWRVCMCVGCVAAVPGYSGGRTRGAESGRCGRTACDAARHALSYASPSSLLHLHSQILPPHIFLQTQVYLRSIPLRPSPTCSAA
jgi:hypothetical protein